MGLGGRGEGERKQTKSNLVKRKKKMQLLVGWWKMTNLATHVPHTSATLSRHCSSGLTDENNMLAL